MTQSHTPLYEMPTEVIERVCFLRQWLNEDRRCDPLVKNEDIWYWIGSAFETHAANEVAKTRNEAINECEGCVPGKLPEVTLQDPYAMERNIGHNSCRNQTLQAISKMRVWK